MKVRTLLTASVALISSPALAGPDAEVRFTEFGVAHVLATTIKGAGKGYGWAFARDNLCANVEQAVRLAGERSRHFDPAATYVDLFAGGAISNTDSDAAHLFLLPDAKVKRLKASSSSDMRDLVAGFVEGFNRHATALALPGEDCRSQPWFRPLREDDVYRLMLHIPLLETSAALVREMAAAAPPAGKQAVILPDTKFALSNVKKVMLGGSNAAAFGKEGVSGGVGGFSFANPHYTWKGTARLHIMHLSVPGKINVFGGTASGLPFPMMGFNDAAGWGITHTTDRRATVYEINVDQADPTRYLVDGKSEPMRAVPIEVVTSKGIIRRTFWETRYGPVIAGQMLPWTPERVYAFADPERENLRFGEQFLALAKAQSVRAISVALKKHHGSPWSNVTAADRSGEAYYSNLSVAGNVTDAQLDRCLVTGPARALMDIADVTVLNGSLAGCGWTIDKRARQPGIIPAANRPETFQSDFTFNSNDSHWLPSFDTNRRLTGFPKVIGPENTARGERSRIAITYAREIMAGPDKGVTPQNWEEKFYSARNLTADLILDDVVSDCRANPSVKVAGFGDVNLRAPCEVLAAWDRKDGTTSRGSALFRVFLEQLDHVPMTGFALTPKYWRVPFDPARPVETPRGFVSDAATRTALATAAYKLNSAELAIDAPLGDVQFVERNGKKLPISGSRYAYHLIRFANPEKGKAFTDALTGDSYIHAVSLLPSGPKGRFLLTYSQSSNPQSPHFADMTELYSAGRWADVRFSEADIGAAQVGETHSIK
ncbi:penicillin acylase family protein [Sphingorhabdus sp.]|uniref:penicillin acylase family protein n=1 Tax=Sphingorhabdus sp. TaxID=1902408 RepID=UPI0037C71777